MNKMHFSLLLGLFFLLGWVAPLATRPAGATPHQPSSSLLLPGDENWLPGFGNGFAGLSHADMGLITADNQGGFYATGQFYFPYLTNPVNVVHYHNGQWTPIILPAPYAEYHYSTFQKLHLALNGDVYIKVAGSTLFKWDGVQLQTFDLTSFGYYNPRFLGTDVLSRPYISGVISDTENPTYIHQWNGTEWVLIGTAVAGESAQQRPPGPWPEANSAIFKMVFDTQNNLYFGGKFTTLNDIPMSSLAKWDGNQWTAVPNNPVENVYDLTLDNSEQLYVAGWNNDSQSWIVAYLQQGHWVQYTADNPIYYLEVNTPQQLFISGDFTEIGGVSINKLAQWNGTTWSNVGDLTLIPDNPGQAGPAIDLDNQNQLWLAEDVFKIGQETGVGMAKWSGSQWQMLAEPTGQGVNETVIDLAVDSEGDIYAAGNFYLAGNQALTIGLARWDGTQWHPIDGAAPCASCLTGTIWSIAIAPDGDIYVTGSLTADNLPTEQKVARWDGTQWSALGTGPVTNSSNYSPKHMVVNSLEHVFVATEDDVAWWNGTEWLSTEADITLDLVMGSNDLLYGAFYNNYIAVWDGTAWSQLGEEIPGVISLVVSPENEIYALGRFEQQTETYFVLHWTGTTWETVGPAVTPLNTGDMATAGVFDTAGNLYITGNFVFEYEGQTFSKIARWDGTNWSPLGSGLSSVINHVGLDMGLDLVINHHGQLFVGGDFTQAGTADAYNLAVWSLPVEKCGLGAGGTHQFYGSQETVKIDVAIPGTLDCVVMQQHRASHPAAPHNLRTGYWWEIVALDANRQPAGGFEVDLTLPFHMFPAEADDKLCFQTDTGWDCASASFDGQTITREGVSQFGVWAVETSLFNASLPIVVKR